MSTAPPPVIVTEDRGYGENRDPGRPPVDWLVDPEEIIDALEDADEPLSMRKAAERAGVSPRTLVRVFWDCGYVIGRTARYADDAPHLPRRRVHRFVELVRCRAALLDDLPYIQAETFASRLGLNPQQAVKLWAKLDEVATTMARGLPVRFDDLPGGPIAERGVDPHRKARKPYTRRASAERAPRYKGIGLGRDEVKQLYLVEGRSIEEIARRARCSPSTLQRRMVDWDIERRKPGPREGMRVDPFEGGIRIQ